MQMYPIMYACTPVYFVSAEAGEGFAVSLPNTMKDLECISNERVPADWITGGIWLPSPNQRISDESSSLCHCPEGTGKEHVVGLSPKPNATNTSSSSHQHRRKMTFSHSNPVISNVGLLRKANARDRFLK